MMDSESQITMNDNIKRAREILGEAIEINPNSIVLGFEAAKLLCGEEQFRFPRSKRKRIRKKWSRDPKNYRPIKNCGFDSLFKRLSQEVEKC